jgi:putative membrane protein
MEQQRFLAGARAEAGTAGNTSPSAVHPLLSKKASDHLANERTFLAWVRTGLATIAFGFVVERLPIPAPLAGGKTQPGLASWAPFSAVVGISLTALGLVMLGLALLNFLHIRANIDRDAFHPPVCFVVLLTILASLIGLLLAVYLILTL